MCHLWELGGGSLYTGLIETPLSPGKLPGTSIVLMLDLSKPNSLWSTVMHMLSRVKVRTMYFLLTV